MKRPSFAVVLVALGLFAPGAVAAAPVAPAQASPVAVELAQAVAPASTTVPAAKIVDRCATRSKNVTRLQKRYRTAKTKRGKARTRRLLNAARRSLKRCRNAKPKPEAAPAPSPSPAVPGVPAPPPGESPAPAPAPAPQPAPTPPETLSLTVNDGPGGTFAPSTTFTIAVSGLPTPPSGTSYRISIRSPAKLQRPPIGCDRSQDSDGFVAAGAAVTWAPNPKWCTGVGRVVVWAGPSTATLDDNAQLIAEAAITVADAAR